MNSMLEYLSHATLILAGITGLLITVYIRHKKTHVNEDMVCPLGSDCKQVIMSEFSTYFGLPIELVGMAYYAIIVLAYLAYVVLPIDTAMFAIFLFPLTFGAFLFSCYLTFIQAVTLRQWCTWCLSSAGLSTLIFIISISITDFSLINWFLTTYQSFIISAHILGIVLGLGAATVGDIIFMKYLSDWRISEHEHSTLRTISQIIWFGLGLLIISGAGIFASNPEAYLTSTKFMAKMIVVSVIIINGAYLNLTITPRLTSINFAGQNKSDQSNLLRMRRRAFMAGAVSAVSWYTAFVLGSLRFITPDFWQFITIYALLLLFGICVAIFVEHRIAQNGSRKIR